MSPRFYTLLSRATAIRATIEREERRSSPNAVRLIRLRQLHLRLKATIRDFATKHLIAIASAPRLHPAFLFAKVQNAHAVSHRR